MRSPNTTLSHQSVWATALRADMLMKLDYKIVLLAEMLSC